VDTTPIIQRAGRILHNDVGPLLSASGLHLQALKMDFPQTAPQVDAVLAILDDAMDRVRALSQELAPSPVRRPAKR
jgi:hypothetical protein